MKNRVITISRQFGSGGRTIGKELAKELGIPCYDQELIEKIAEDSGLAKEFVEEQGENTFYSTVLANAFSTYSYTSGTTQDYLWNIQKKVIRELAEKGPCVIVGRCADFILRNHADCLTVFIHADMEERAHRIVNLYGEKDDSPKKRLVKKDKRRAAYFRFYTDLEWGDVKNYHISLDSGALGIEKCVEILKNLY